MVPGGGGRGPLGKRRTRTGPPSWVRRLATLAGGAVGEPADRAWSPGSCGAAAPGGGLGLEGTERAGERGRRSAARKERICSCRWEAGRRLHRALEEPLCPGA